MRLGRIATPEGMTFCVLEGNTARAIAGTPFTAPEFTDKEWPLDEVRLLAPMLPSKILVVDEERRMHIKPPTSVVGPGAPIRVPDFAADVTVAGAVGVVIGRPCKAVAAANWRSVVCGITAVADITAGRPADGQGTGLDTFCPLGPWIETKFEDAVSARVEVGAARSEYTPEELGKVIEWASRGITLLPGDIVAAAPALGVGPVERGARVCVAVPGVGELSQPVS